MVDKTENGKALLEAVERDEECTQRGREMLESLYPDSGGSLRPERSEPDEDEDEIEEDEENAPSSRPSLAEAKQDLKEGVGAFVAGVDTITNALLAILGKFDESIRRIEAVNRLMKIGTLLSFLAVIVVAIVLIRLELVVINLQANESAMLAVRTQLESSLIALQNIRVQQTKTDEKVDAVKKEVKDEVKEVKDAVMQSSAEPPSPRAPRPTRRAAP